MVELLLLIAFLLLVIASFTDIKTREVPDIVSYGGIFAGIGIRLFFSAAAWSSSFIVEGFLGFVFAFIIAQLMYKLRQWGGGDSKMLIALGILLGVRLDLGHVSVAFILNLLVAGAVYGICWSAYLGIKHRHVIAPKLRDVWNKTLMLRIAAYSLFLVLFAASFFMDMPSKAVALILAFTSIGLLFLWVLMKSIEDTAFLKKVSVERLAEGDWIAKAVKVKYRIVCSPADFGVSKKQIAELKKLMVRTVWIKEGIPFIPSFLIAFIASLTVGNVLLEILRFLI